MIRQHRELDESKSEAVLAGGEATPDDPQQPLLAQALDARQELECRMNRQRRPECRPRPMPLMLSFFFGFRPARDRYPPTEPRAASES